MRRVRGVPRDQQTLCENLFPLLNGAYAELLLVPTRIARVNLHPVPAGMAPEVAAMVEPLACCLHGVERAGVAAGDTVAIVGIGPIGLMLCACVADAGGSRWRSGAAPERRALAPAFGAHAGDGSGADVVIEAAGTVEAWERALELVRPGGTVLAFGGLPREARVAVDPYRIHYEEVSSSAPSITPRATCVRRSRSSGAACAVRAARHAPGRAGGGRRAAGRAAGGLPQGRGRSLTVRPVARR